VIFGVPESRMISCSGFLSTISGFAFFDPIEFEFYGLPHNKMINKLIRSDCLWRTQSRESKWLNKAEHQGNTDMTIGILCRERRKNSKSSLKILDSSGEMEIGGEVTATHNEVISRQSSPVESTLIRRHSLRCNFDLFLRFFFSTRMEDSVPVAGERSRLLAPLFVQLRIRPHSFCCLAQAVPKK